ncbi:phosphatase PAP2 family protein [Spirosoma radiotolerans]|uniref:phosphatase PAP2 family protein n=1 Tax=Spirosoma radiotolerans TaxID=1379870 RepID=UPI0011DCC2FB|nr:phosphatase PAP2 family protein [Spirosoma radiotolerans]
MPITWHNYSKVKRGRYADFDLSNQTQRAGFYPIVLLFSGLFTLFLISTSPYQPFNRGAVCFFLLLTGSYAINIFLKVSLHTAVSFFLACALFGLDEYLGVLMGLFSVLIAVSRLVLKRHSLPEIIAGVLIGLVAGASL